MKVKYILKIIIFGSCALLTMNSLNIIPYEKVTPLLIAMIISGPISAFVFFKKRHWLKAIVSILLLSGASGLLQIAAIYGKAELYGNELSYSSLTYIYHAVISIVFITVFLVWYFIVGRKENMNDF